MKGLKTIAGALALLFAAACSSGGDKVGNSGMTGEEMLAAYGVDYDLGAPKDRDGNDIEGDVNPFGRAIT